MTPLGTRFATSAKSCDAVMSALASWYSPRVTRVRMPASISPRESPGDASVGQFDATHGATLFEKLDGPISLRFVSCSSHVTKRRLLDSNFRHFVTKPSNVKAVAELRPGQRVARALAYCAGSFRRAVVVTTGSIGTSLWDPLLPVFTPPILSTTSMPSTTRANRRSRSPGCRGRGLVVLEVDEELGSGTVDVRRARHGQRASGVLDAVVGFILDGRLGRLLFMSSVKPRPES